MEPDGPLHGTQHTMIDFAYITSAGHSGSTLLTLLLNAHPQIASVGESSAVLGSDSPDGNFCSCGMALRDCGFWRSIRSELACDGIEWESGRFQTRFRTAENRFTDRLLRAEYRGRWFETLRDALLCLSPRWRRRAPELVNYNLRLVQAVLKTSGGRVFLDSSKEPSRLKFMLRIPSLRAKVIHLVRDGRAVASSFIRRGESSMMSEAAEEWRRDIVSEEHVLRLFGPDEVIRLRYEDLCADVEGSVLRLFRFLGVDTSSSIAELQDAEHHILGNRMRLVRSGEIQVDNRWRAMLGSADLKTFERIAGDLNRSYGYE